VEKSERSRFPFHLMTTTAASTTASTSASRVQKDLLDTYLSLCVTLEAGITGLVGSKKSERVTERIGSMSWMDLEMFFCELTGMPLPTAWCEVGATEGSYLPRGAGAGGRGGGRASVPLTRWIEVVDEAVDYPFFQTLLGITLFIPQSKEDPSGGEVMNRLDTKSLHRMRSSSSSHLPTRDLGGENLHTMGETPAAPAPSAVPHTITSTQQQQQQQILEIQHLHRLQELSAFLTGLEEKFQSKQQILANLLTKYRQIRRLHKSFEKDLQLYLPTIVLEVDRVCGSCGVAGYEEYLQKYLKMKSTAARAGARSRAPGGAGAVDVLTRGGGGDQSIRNLVEDLAGEYQRIASQRKEEFISFERELLDDFRDPQRSSTHEKVRARRPDLLSPLSPHLLPPHLSPSSPLPSSPPSSLPLISSSSPHLSPSSPHLSPSSPHLSPSSPHLLC
jgi:hypothetical protein